jgi:teichuronic acid biosynthesis glycosyltransferase TuaG
MSNNAIQENLKFSVVIPAYNAENTIERAISSVLAQSYPPFEIIIVDDASKDKTQEIIESKYADAVRYIQKISNNGSSVARNTGMDAAKGDYIAFLDADDAWHPDKLLLINTILCANPGITLFYHQYIYILHSAEKRY